MTAARTIADWTTSLTLDDVPEDVAEHAKLHFLDAIGCGWAASALGVATEGRTAMAEAGGEAQASVIGLDAALPAPSAAFANGMLCHGLDFDDTHADSVSHVSVVVCPAALATAEAQGSSGAELLAAIVAGNEVVTRVGMAASGLFHKRGFHPTAICGIFGGTAAAAKLLGADAAATASALGIAGSFAGGLFAYLDDATATKPFHPAWAAHGSTLAARLAQLGGEGPPGVLEGRFGLYHAFLGAEQGEIPIDEQLADLGSRWETPRIAYKGYPACHFIHGSLGATAGLAPLDPDEIEDVVVTIPEAGVSLVLEPADAKITPRTVYEAKFSLQYSTATMLVHGSAGLAAYSDEAIADPKVLELARRVRYETKEYPTYPGAFPGGVRITMRDGTVHEAELPYQRGGPENPLTDDEVRAKFRENAGLALSAEAVEALEQTILSLERLDDVAGLLRQPVARVIAAERAEVVQTIRDWVEREVYPVASEYEHADEFPTALVEQMKELGLFGVTIPEEYGGLGLDLTTYALIQVELSRGWMSLSGVLNTHFISAWMIKTFGTDEQREHYLPRMATGEIRSAYSMTEPHAGTDVQAIRTRAVRDGDGWSITGQKMWATNGLRAGMMTLLAVTDPDAEPRHRGLTAFVLEKEPGVAEQPGLTIGPPLKKLGYKGVESVELAFDGFRAPADAVLGGEAGIGEGFKYFMGGIELGRVNIAARAVGIATRAFEESIRYAQERETFGKPIAQHQAIQLKLAQMATKIEAARLLMMQAAERKDAGERADLEAGMAKWFATETAEEVAFEAMRIHGGYGYSQEFVVERLYRDAPVLVLGEGSNEIQQLVIARRLLERYAI